MKTLRQFEVVAEVARQKSISKAADALNVSQPTISKFLQTLEFELGLELFDRTVVPLQLTAAGDRYLAAANKILDINRRLDKELCDIKNRHDNALRIGISPSRAPYILPDLIETYRVLRPAGRIVVQEGNMQHLNELLIRGEVDLIVSLLTDETRCFSYELLFTETVLLAAPQSMAHLTVSEILKKQPMVTIGKGLELWKVTNKVLEYLGGAEPAIECLSIESALSLVKRGLGAMLVPSYIANYSNNMSNSLFFQWLPDGCMQQFHGDLHREVGVFYRNSAFLTEAERSFIEACKRMKHAYQTSF